LAEAFVHPVNAQNILSGFHLIEADAGTGKTWTLASLVVRAIREGRYQLGEVLVVTFTNAATSELAERIRLFLQEAFDAASEQVEADIAHSGSEKKIERERLRLALAQIDTLRVQTIHGFCQSVLTENSFALDLPAKLLLREGSDLDLSTVVAHWWREKVLARGLKLDDRLWQALFSAGLSLKVIRGVLKHALSDPDLMILPEAKALGLHFSLSEGGDAAKNEARNEQGIESSRQESHEHALINFFETTLREQEMALEAVQEALRKSGEDLLAWLCGPARKLARSGVKMGSTYQDKRGQKWIQDLLSVPKVEALYGEAGSKLVSRFARSVIKEFVDAEDYPFAEVLDPCDRLLALLPVLNAANALLAQHLGSRVLADLHEHRKASGELGFDGLLQEVYLLVSRSPVTAALLRERYPLAMIDESQDTDPLQWAIFEKIYLPLEPALGAKGGLIMVGDPKQSIYSFRGADVYTYLRAGERVLERHHLSVNRRSSPVVIEAINLMFNEKRLAKQAFNQQDIQFLPALVDSDAPWSQVSSCFELIRFEAGDVPMPEKKRLAVQACVERIFALKAESESKTSDIAVLVYSHSEAALVEAALEQRGIGCARVSTENVWHGRWAHELLLVLQSIEHSASFSALNRALLTEAFAHEETAQSLQSRVLEAAHAWQRIGPQAALAGLLLQPYLSLQAYTAYQQLIELVGGEFLASSTPREVALWLEAKYLDSSKQDSSAPWRLNDPGAVKLMTIHHSKGLEFDTVFVPFAWIKEKGAARSLEIQRHHRLLAGSWRSVVDTMKSEESRLCLENEKLSENLRLFYVTVTRAQRQLFLFAPDEPDPGSPLEYLQLNGFPMRISRLGDVQADAGADEPSLPAESEVVANWALLAPSVDVASDWRWHSYSALTRYSELATSLEGSSLEAHRAIQAADYEQGTEQGAEQTGAQELSDSDLDLVDPRANQSMRFRFPKGAKAGVVLHGLLEKHPFGQSLSLDQLRSQLMGAGMPEVLDSLDEINLWLDEVLSTPLAVLGGAGLKSLDPKQRKMELGFTLGISQVSWEKILTAIERHFPVSEGSKALLRPDLFSSSFGTSYRSKLNGFLNGFIDMVFEWQGKYYILDWKSNFLGEKFSDYRGSALEQAIAEHDYAVQWCLYSVALLRWLSLKLPGQDPLQKIGGVVYAFIRGMGGANRGAGQGAEHGVYYAPVPPQLLIELDSLMGGTSLTQAPFGIG
jgi:exodeoxyribonuclease V beta subunit